MNLCDVLGNCLLLRGPGRDVTDPRADTRQGWVRGAEVGRLDLLLSVKSGIAEGRGLNARYHTATRSSCPKCTYAARTGRLRLSGCARAFR